MKEIGKLIELLNEYRTEKLRREMYANGADKEAIELSEAERINEYEVSQTLDSQNYLKSFVKWLVENDKIERKKVGIYAYNYAIAKVDFNHIGYKEPQILHRYLKDDGLLMLLSISSSPIEDLISYLK